jgi:hypothetical protein
MVKYFMGVREGHSGREEGKEGEEKEWWRVQVGN